MNEVHIFVEPTNWSGDKFVIRNLGQDVLMGSQNSLKVHASHQYSGHVHLVGPLQSKRWSL